MFAGFLAAAEVPAVSEALRAVDKRWLRSRFDALAGTDYAAYGGPLDDDLFAHVWQSLEHLREFYAGLVSSGGSMVFSVEG